MASPKPLGSVSRAITIVTYLAGKDSGVPLGVIARDLNINKATVYNTLATLREHNWVEQDADTGNYALGDGISPIARYQTSTMRVVNFLRPHLATIGATFNELVHLGQLIDTDVIYLDKVEPSRSIRVVSQIGKRTTAVTTSLGRALIGSLPHRERQLDWYMTTPAVVSLSSAHQEALRESVLANFDHLDEHGWTQEIEENEPGIACVAVPLVSKNGTHLAISISAPAERMTPDYREKLALGIRRELDRLDPSDGIHARPLAQ